jgi:hypothetical protein
MYTLFSFKILKRAPAQDGRSRNYIHSLPKASQMTLVGQVNPATTELDALSLGLVQGRL